MRMRNLWPPSSPGRFLPTCSRTCEVTAGARQGYVARPCGGSSGDRSRDYTSILGEIDPYVLCLWRQSCQYFGVLIAASWSVWPFEQLTNEAADHTLPWLSVWLLLLLHSDLLHGNILVSWSQFLYYPRSCLIDVNMHLGSVWREIKHHRREHMLKCSSSSSFCLAFPPLPASCLDACKVFAEILYLLFSEML
jgi:hypothetical protein